MVVADRIRPFLRLLAHPTAVSDDTADAADGDADTTFERELARARELLADETDLTAIHVGVVRGDQVNSTAARRSEGEQAGLETLALLASHLRTVAEEAGVDFETVAADAAQLAGQVEALPQADVEGDAEAGVREDGDVETELREDGDTEE